MGWCQAFFSIDIIRPNYNYSHRPLVRFTSIEYFWLGIGFLRNMKSVFLATCKNYHQQYNKAWFYCFGILKRIHINQFCIVEADKSQAYLFKGKSSLFIMCR